MKRALERAQADPKKRVNKPCICTHTHMHARTHTHTHTHAHTHNTFTHSVLCIMQGGRKLVYRSEPPVLKRKAKDAADKKNKEEEELQYFFS